MTSHEAGWDRGLRVALGFALLSCTLKKQEPTRPEILPCCSP